MYSQSQARNGQKGKAWINSVVVCNQTSAANDAACKTVSAVTCATAMTTGHSAAVSIPLFSAERLTLRFLRDQQQRWTSNNRKSSGCYGALGRPVAVVARTYRSDVVLPRTTQRNTTTPPRRGLSSARPLCLREGFFKQPLSAPRSSAVRVFFFFFFSSALILPNSREPPPIFSLPVPWYPVVFSLFR